MVAGPVCRGGPALGCFEMDQSGSLEAQRLWSTPERGQDRSRGLTQDRRGIWDTSAPVGAVLGLLSPGWRKGRRAHQPGHSTPSPGLFLPASLGRLGLTSCQALCTAQEFTRMSPGSQDKPPVHRWEYRG